MSVKSSLTGAGLALGVTVPLAWKWELGVQRVATATAALAVPAAGAAGLTRSSDAAKAAMVAAGTVGAAFGILAYRFYRDPERTPPVSDEDIVVSPADGTVLYVRHAPAGVLPRSTKLGRDYDLVELTGTPLRDDDVVVVGIAMSFLDVHINRAPIAGRIRLREHFPGKFGSLGRAEMVFENERATTVIERDDCEVAMVQIASRLVRQIASFVEVGEEVAMGDRVGVIRLGSQVDLVLPARAAVKVAEGDYVYAGESVVAVLEPAPVNASATTSGDAVASG